MGTTDSVLLSFQANALLVQSGLTKVTESMASSYRHLVGGSRLDQASDSPKDRMTSVTLRSQLSSQSALLENLQTGISLLDVALSAIDTMMENTISARSVLQTRANDDSDLSIQQHRDLFIKYRKLLEDNYQIVDATAFNGLKLFDGGFGTKIAAEDFAAGQSYSITIQNLTIAATYPVDSGTAVYATDLDGSLYIDLNGNSTNDETTTNFKTDAQAALATFDNRMLALEKERNVLAARRQSFTTAVNAITSQQIEISGIESKLSTTDLTEEGAAFARASVFQEAALAALGESLDLTQIVLRALDFQVYGGQ